ncbi:helix-turn-helix domain-containing protein, partial [Salinispora arenicola]|uniref:helix-turn-helix domain-containing protein n=1 Tax=Salinispora arenicola TaxID=168697 RepID=UPI000516382F
MEPTTGDRLARLRRQAGFTQEQLAARSGISVEVVRKLEQGSRNTARLDTLHALARVLGAPTSALFGDVSRAAAQAGPEHQPLLLTEIRRAVVPVHDLSGSPMAVLHGEPPSFDTLRANLHAADQAYNAGDYPVALAAVPPLLWNVRAIVDQAGDDTQAKAYDLL